MTARTVLITGASGSLGVKLRTGLRKAPSWTVRAVDRSPRGDPDVLAADLESPDPRWLSQLDGVDAVVHLAGASSVAADWDALTGSNVDAVLNLYIAAAARGVTRIVLASSVWAAADRRRDTGAITEGPPAPGGQPYAASKLFAERVALAFHRSHGLSTIILRLGACRPGANPPLPPFDPWEDGIWLSNEDFVHGVLQALETTRTDFGVFHLISQVEHSRWDITAAREMLGYAPTGVWRAASDVTQPMRPWRVLTRSLRGR